MQSVLTLVIGAELLAVALVLASSGLYPFQWEQLGRVSFLVQWVVLLCAALLCPLRVFLSGRSLLLAGSFSYGLVLAVTLLVSLVGQWLLHPGVVDYWQLATHLLLAAIFGGIVLRYFYIQQQLLRQEESELNARIQALQSRIRPHFLFNCMNSIVSLIGSDPDKAERVVEDLSDLFRASLAEPGMVPLQHELRLCERYIRIEQLRLGKRLKMHWKVADDLPEDCEIPSLLLQPLIENAIYHGIQPRAEGGTVEISVQAGDNQVILTVRNPLPQGGVGTAKPGNRVAIGNIRNRLAAYYGERATFNVGPQGDVFVTKISMPFTAQRSSGN